MMGAVLLVLVLSQGPEGHEVAVNPAHVASMRSSIDGEPNKYVTGTAHCVINTSDGKFISVVETCATVRKLFDEAEQLQTATPK